MFGFTKFRFEYNVPWTAKSVTLHYHNNNNNNNKKKKNNNGWRQVGQTCLIAPDKIRFN